MNNLNPRRGRFIAPTADLSALGAGSDVPLHLLITIIGPPCLSYYPDYCVKRNYQNKCKKKGAQVCRLRPSYFLSYYTYVLVCNTSMHAEDSDFLSDTIISIR